MELFLTSSVAHVADSIASKLDLSHGRKLVFIDTPADPERGGDLSWLTADRQALVNAGFEVADYTIVGKTKSQLGEDLANYDYIYGSGGDTLYMLEKAYESGFIEVIRNLVIDQGKIYISTSASSILAAPKPHDYLLAESDTNTLNEKIPSGEIGGYDFVNFLVLPHWGSEYFKKKYLSGRLRQAYTENQLPMITLTDNQYVHVKDNLFEIITV